MEAGVAEAVLAAVAGAPVGAEVGEARDASARAG